MENLVFLNVQGNGAQQEQIEEEIMSLIKMNMDSAVILVQSITVRSHVISTRALFLIVYKHFVDKKLLSRFHTVRISVFQKIHGLVGKFCRHRNDMCRLENMHWYSPKSR